MKEKEEEEEKWWKRGRGRRRSQESRLLVSKTHVSGVGVRRRSEKLHLLAHPALEEHDAHGSVAVGTEPTENETSSRLESFEITTSGVRDQDLIHQRKITTKQTGYKSPVLKTTESSWLLNGTAASLFNSK